MAILLIVLLPPCSVGAGGGTRTHTPIKATDFESASSTIPTHQHIKLRNAFLGCQLKVDSMCKIAVSVPMVGTMGVEPTRFWRRNLNPMRLPIPPHPHISAKTILTVAKMYGTATSATWRSISHSALRSLRVVGHREKLVSTHLGSYYTPKSAYVVTPIK